MDNSEGIQAIVNYVTIQAATAVLMALRDVDVGSKPAITTGSQRKPKDKGMSD